MAYSICRAGCTSLPRPAGGLANPMSNGAMVTATNQTIDVHAHVLTEETIRLLQSEAPKVAPKLSEIDDEFGTLDVAGNVYRKFPRGGWIWSAVCATWRPP